MADVWRAAYVASVATLTAFAAWNPNDPRVGLLWLSFVFTLPTSIALLPLFYVVAAIAWNVSGADDGGRTWPVTLTYAAALTAIAVASQLVVMRLRRRTTRSQPV